MLYLWVFAGVYGLFELWKLGMILRAARVEQVVAAGWEEAGELPAGVAGRLAEGLDALRALGFEAVLTARNGSVPESMGMVQVVAEARQASDPTLRAFISVVGFTMLGKPLLQHTFEYTSTTGAGRTVSTTCMAGVGDYATDRNVVVRLVKLRDPAVLLAAHRKLVPRYGGARRNEAASVKALNQVWRTTMDDIVRRGEGVLSADGTRYRKRWVPAVVETLAFLPGVRHARAWRAGRRQGALLRELGFNRDEVEAAATFRLPGEAVTAKVR